MSSPNSLCREAMQVYRDGDRHRSAAMLRDATQKFKQAGEPYARLAEVLTYSHQYWHNPEQAKELVASGELVQAVELWERAFGNGFECSWHRFCMGHALTALDRPDEAASHLRRAIDLKTLRNHPDLAGDYAAAERAGPDFLIIGATKCGTTSLYEYLAQHPKVLPALYKEPEFFRFPDRGEDWYLGHFPRTPAGFLTGEASSCYLSLWDAKDLIYQRYPDIRLIALLRDPVDKAISHVHHDVKLGCEHRSVDVAINTELDILEALDDPFHDAADYWQSERGYVWLGLYAYMLENWLTRFSREQLLIIPSEDLWQRPEATVADAFRFLGIAPHQLPDYEVHLPGAYDRSKPEPVRERLRLFFRRHNEALFNLLGHTLDWQ